MSLVELFKGQMMAVEPKDVKTMNMFSDDDKQWMLIALAGLEKSVERAMTKYPQSSGAYRAHNEDLAKIRSLKERCK